MFVKASSSQKKPQQPKNFTLHEVSKLLPIKTDI